ncbi:YdcF family protein [Telmatospirillum sp. J64-1]|uniref:YdcF family protein n=1 Tax=Telmatospirillum sp. J64-1 TaxID=2502183 RepID=UPI00163DAB14|nr:YdcF family protein [Telmatospirillum sp. J64-1]
MTQEVPPFDAAVVLGAKVYPDGTPSPALLRRIEKAEELWRRGRVGHLLLSGGVGEPPFREACVMRDILQARGLPGPILLTEETSRNTLDNARFCARILAEQGWRRVLLVTDDFHLPRALYAFRRFGIAARPCAVRSPAPWRLPFLLACLREAVAFPVYLWRVERARRKG